MNTGTTQESQPASEFLHFERWHGFANAAVVALLGVPLVNPTGSARAAFWELSQLVIGFSRSPRPRKRDSRI